MEKTNQNNFTFQNVNTSKCKIRNVRVQQHYCLLLPCWSEGDWRRTHFKSSYDFYDKGVTL